MLVELPGAAAEGLLRAMATVATGGGRGPLSPAAAEAIESLAVLGLGAEAPEAARLDPIGPAELADLVAGAEEAGPAVEILGITALVDGELDQARIEEVLAFAAACGRHDHWLEDLWRSPGPDLGAVIADMADHNLRSVTDGRLNLAEVGDLNDWLFPNRDDHEDRQLVARYEALGGLPAGTVGREFWSFYTRHGFGFPGQAGSANEMFTTPHDATHLISGYDTTPQGEMLVSMFTARMHPVYPMEGHILPVIYSWHLGIEITELAGSTTGALDAPKLWVAWERGQRTEHDTFGHEFDFWAHVETPLEELRRDFGVPPLDPRYAAESDARPGIDYHPVA